MFEKTFLGRLIQSFALPKDTAYNSAATQGDEVAHIKDGNFEHDIETRVYKREYKWVNIIFLAMIHFFAMYTVFWFNEFTLRLIVWGYLWCLFSTIGITAGVHRLWAHKSYKATLPMKVFLLFCFSTTGQNNVFEWVRDHRVHHKYSDTNADPHNATRGFFFSHMGWLMVKKHPEVIAKGKTIDMSDIENDPLLAWHRNNFIPVQLMTSFVIPTIIPPLLWSEAWMPTMMMMCFFKYALVLNSTWSVNSAAHIWGKKPFDRKIAPSDNVFVSQVSFGEGWHNYHHAFPWDYKAQEYGPYGLSFTTKVIDVAAKLGLVYDLKEPSKDLVEKVARNHGDGTWEEQHDTEQNVSKID